MNVLGHPNRNEFRCIDMRRKAQSVFYLSGLNPLRKASDRRGVLLYSLASSCEDKEPCKRNELFLRTNE